MSAGQAIGGVIGGVIGFYVGGPSGAMYGFQAGMAIGGYLDQPMKYGPRLDDLRQQLSVYGAPIPFEYGTNRHAGTVIWPQILEATEHSQTESAKGGPEQTNYTYTMSFAILVCEGPIAGIRRIWANKKLIYDASSTNEGATQDPLISAMRIYLGTEDQEVDPLIEATDGASPAYLGYAYVVFEDYDVTELNARLPQFEFEVVTSGNPADADASPMGECGNAIAYDPNTGYVWSVEGTPSTKIDIYVTDLINEELVNHIEYQPNALAASMGNDITYNPSLNEFWIANENGTQVVRVNATTYAIGEENSYHWPAVGGVYLTWRGLIHYSALHDNIVLAETNVSDDMFVIDATSGAIVGAVAQSGSVFGVDQIMTLGDGSEAVLGFHYVNIVIFNGASSSIINHYANTDIGSDAFMAPDWERNKILILNESSTTVIELDLNTGLYQNHVLTFPGLPPTGSTNLRRILWHSQNDKYYITAHQAGLGWTLHTVNPETFEVEYSRLYSGPLSLGSLLEIPDHPDFLVYADSGTNTIWKLPLFNRLNPLQVSLDDIVLDICVRSGLTTSDIDVSQLTDSVYGYIVPRQMSARAALEPLQQAFYFDAVESDDKIKFVKRGSSTATTIPIIDRAAVQEGTDLTPSLEIRRAFDTELPIQCDVEYPDFDADHQIGNQYDRRITKDTKHRVNLQLPIVMNAQKAKEIARSVLYQAWQNQTFKWCTSRKYAYLEPTDIVNLPTDATIYRARITNRRDQPNGQIEWEGSIDAVEVYTQSGTDAVTPPYTPQTIFEPSNTYLVLMDIPMLRDDDDNAGYYSAMGGSA